MRPIPGSSRLAGGELLCMYHTLEPALILDDWHCNAVYMRVAGEWPRPYDDVDIKAVFDGIAVMRQDLALAAFVLMKKGHAPNMPLPMFFTVNLTKCRVDFYVYTHDDVNYMYASLIRNREDDYGV